VEKPITLVRMARRWARWWASMVASSRRDHRRPDHALGHDGEQRAHPPADLAVRGREALLERPDHQDGRHERGVHDHRQLPGVDGHDQRGDDDLAGADEQDHAAPLQELGDLVDVARDPGDQRPSAFGLLVQHGQVVHVPERAGAYAGERRLADREQPAHHQVAARGRGHEDHGGDHDDHEDHAEVRSVGALQPAVDALLHGDGHGDAAGHGDHGEGQRAGQSRP
jgi:hypothetical protein